MLNPFPIQFLSLFAYLLLRFFVGSILIYLGLLHHYKRKELHDVLVCGISPFGRINVLLFALLEIVIGGLLVLGAFTQYAALAGMAMCVSMLFLRNHLQHSALPHRLFYLLLFASLLSLFITGAGAIAFDLPI